MDAQSYKTVMLNENTVKQDWLLIDVADLVLGRAASRIAILLRGKHKASFTPHVNCGDKVVIINAEKIKLTGTKMDNRTHLRHTGYPGGQREQTPRKILAKKPCKLIEQAIKRMLPKNRLGDEMYRNLHVYAGTEHPHQAQNPTPYTIKL